MDPIYLDYNATTPLDPAVIDAMRPWLEGGFGNPSSGHWTITHTNNDSDVQTTTPLAYDASASDVESALGEFVGWSDVSVTLSGAVYTVKFNAVEPAGDQALLTTANTFDAGSITVAEDTAGEDAYEYRALAVLGTAATEVTTIRQRLHNLALIPNGVYAWSLQAKKIAATTETLYIEIVDGTGAVVTDDEGNSLRSTVTIATDMSDSAFTPLSGFFHLPTDLPDIYYIQLRIAADMGAGEGFYLDDFILVAATELYTGGPYVALLVNDRDLQDGDRYTIVVANDWAGKIQSWFWRWFERLLPSVNDGSETITDP